MREDHTGLQWLTVLTPGLGERGFRSSELRLLGPGTVVVGLGLTLTRVLICLISSSACLARLREDVISVLILDQTFLDILISEAFI